MSRSILSVTILFAAWTSAIADDQCESADSCRLCPKETAAGFVPLFDGETHEGWLGDTKGYPIENGILVCAPGGKLMTEKEYADFQFRFEFKLPPGGNNGVAIRAPLEGNAAYNGMEIQVLDDGHKKYEGWLKDYQHHGSIYGVVPAKTGHLKPVGEWNSEEIVADGSHIKVTLNGEVIVDADLSKIEETMDEKDHPGLHNKQGHIGFLGHGDRVEFRNIRVRELNK